jgi:hypothetical protein
MRCTYTKDYTYMHTYKGPTDAHYYYYYFDKKRGAVELSPRAPPTLPERDIYVLG